MYATRWCLVCSIACLGVFVSAPARAERSPCPPGSRPGLSGCVDGSARAKLRQTPEAGRVAIEPRLRVPDLDPETFRDPPRALNKQKRALLMTELARLEALLRRTPTKSPDRAGLIRRLAEGYAELAADADRDRLRAELELEQAEREERTKAKAAPKSGGPYPTRL
jgi:hypothetical protein